MCKPLAVKCLSLALLVSLLSAVEVLATSAPSNLAATGVSSSQVALTWTDNSSSETGYTFAFDTNGALTSPTYVYAGGVNTTSHSHLNRSVATTYYYKIKAEGNPDSAWSAIDSATTAPSGLAAVAASNASINLTWTGNGSNAAITGYTYAWSTNSSFSGATYTYVAGNGSTSASRTGLSTATTYWFKLKAEGTSDALDSPYGAVVKTTTTPASLAASVVSSSQVNLSWTGNAGNANILGYTIAYATNSSFSGAAYRYVAGAATAGASLTDLYAGTTYYFKIKVEGLSDSYDSAFTAYIAATTHGAAPNAPSNLTASVVSSSQINLGWTDNSTDETSFEVKRARDAAFTQGVSWIGGIQGTSYSDTGLSASTTYYYKVRAKGVAQDSAYSAPVSATTNPSGDSIPDAPSGLGATAVSGTQVNLSWTDNSGNETGFELKRATDSAFTQGVVWIGGVQGSSYANTGLNHSTTYYYKVRAEGTAGKSAYSSSATATTDGPSVSSGTPITLPFAGINAWMPWRIGRTDHWGKLSTNPDDPIWSKVQESGAEIMRYGGHAVDRDADPTWTETMDQYVMMVDAMRSKGIEPILQVPVYGTKFSAPQAADIVRHVNFVNGVRAPRAVTYWVIGNEPDLEDAGYGPTGYTTHQVADYMKAFAAAMKDVDPLIKIIGPETAWYNTTIINGLTTCGGGDDVTGLVPGENYYHVDILSFHIYPFNGTQTDRATVIGKLTATDGFEDRVAQLRDRLDDCNAFHGRTGANALRMAVTEANINYQNNSSDSVYGLGAKSFLGGQFWAEMMGIAMQQGVDFITFWSTVEGNGLSYLSSDGTTRRPSYYHFQMMAQNFRGSSISASNDQPKVKTFAAEDVDQIVVMIMNQETATSFNYTIRFNTGSVSGTNPLKIKVSADTDPGIEYNSASAIAPESSILLVFDPSGGLRKKVEYKLHGHADTTPPSPPAVTNY